MEPTTREELLPAEHLQTQLRLLCYLIRQAHVVKTLICHQLPRPGNLPKGDVRFASELVFERGDVAMAKDLVTLGKTSDLIVMWAFRLEPSRAQIIPIGVQVATASQVHVPANAIVPVK